MIQYKEANSGLMRVNVCMRVATFVCLHPFAQGCVLLAPSEMDPHLASLGSGAVWVELTELEDRVAVRLYHRPDASDFGHGWWSEVGVPRLMVRVDSTRVFHSGCAPSSASAAKRLFRKSIPKQTIPQDLWFSIAFIDNRRKTRVDWTS